MAAVEIAEDLGERRTRRRVRSIVSGDKKKRTEIVQRVLDFYDRDWTDCAFAREDRLQRYAKFRGWVEGKDWPWQNASDVALTDMMEKSLRIQDTLHNAVMSQTPPVGAKALKPHDQDKVNTVDNLINHEVFNEQAGEEVMGDIIDAFVNDGDFTCFIPWVTEERESMVVKMFDMIPDDAAPTAYFSSLIRQTFPGAVPRETSEDGWDWFLEGEDGPILVKFYTKSNEVEMVIETDVTVFDGPKLIVKDWEDVLTPPRSANLQIPGPSNPGGASHVILVDRPTVDEVARLVKSGFYDLASTDDIGAMRNAGMAHDDEKERQKDQFQGVTQESEQKVKSHKTLTRLMCFDMMDIDGDGRDEDVIFWVIKETKTLLRARRLTEVYPMSPPKRPLISKSMLPVRGRRHGMGVLEILEGLHDAMKVLMDQTIDGGTIKNLPFWFYRPSGSIKPEIVHLAPGDGFPLSDPQRDVNFPTWTPDNGFGFNMLSLLANYEEKVTLIGDLQLGRVPAGRSSALRTIGGMALLSGQGEARPERILRRLFMGLCEIWETIHSLNQHFLTKEKQVMISGIEKPSDDPYQMVKPGDISGNYRFTFSANVFNTSKEALQSSLAQLMQAYLSPLSVQLGMMQPDGAYRLFRDFGKALGQDPDRYLQEPFPGAMKPSIMAEEALSAIIDHQMPDGRPAEGAQAHYQKLDEFARSDNIGLLDEASIGILKVYMQKMVELVALETRQAQLAQAAGQQGMAQQGGPQPQAPVDQGSPMISGGNELVDETLPTARGEMP